MARFQNHGKGVWMNSRPDTFPNGTSRRPLPTGRREGGGFARPPADDCELETRQPEGIRHDDGLNSKLDRLLDRLDKLEVWREEGDRKFDTYDQPLSRDLDSPSGFDDGDDWEDDGRRRRSGERGYNIRNSSSGFRDIQPRDRGRRDDRGRTRSCWDPPGNRPTRNRYSGAEQQFARPTSCWDPPQRFLTHLDTFEKPQWVKMQAPRFDRHPTHATQRHRPTCWDPPARQQHRGYPTFDRPRRSDTSWDRPHPQDEVRARRVHPVSHQPRYTAEQPLRDLYSQPARVTSRTPDQPPRSPTCWDPPGARVSMDWLDYEESASRYYSDYDCESDGYDEDFGVGYISQTIDEANGFMANEFDYPSDIEKRVCIERIPHTAPSSHLWQSDRPIVTPDRMLRQSSHCPPHVADPRHDPSINSLPTVGVAPSPPPQRSSSCLSMTSYCRSAALLPVVAVVPSSNLPPTAPSCSPHDDNREESGLLDELSPPAVFSASCSPNISGKEETLLEDGVARERKTVDEEKSTVIVKGTILLNGDENGLMEEAVNCLHEVSYPSVMVYALTCAGGSKIIREEADRENDDISKRITLIRLCAFDPGICVSFSKRNCEFLAMHMEAMDLQVEDEKLHIDNVFWNALNMLSDDDKELPHGGFLKCLLDTKTFNIGLNMPAKPVVFTNVQKFDGDYVRRRLPIWCVFDPGGDASP